MDEPESILPDTPENRALVENVHPAGWINPEPAERYNLVVVGAGTAGLVCAAGAAGLGAKVALIERHMMGGDCLNVGCVPSKGLIRAARAVFDARTAHPFGIDGAETLGFDFGRAMARMRTLRTSISRHDSARRFRDELGVDVYFGQASFTASDCITVESRRLYFHRAAICTGTRAAVPQIPGLADAGFRTNETIFSLTALPPRMAVIGAGPIGCELAQAFARFGCRVTLIELGHQILGREDRDAAEILHDALIREGIALQLGVEILRVEQRKGEKVVVLRDKGAEVEVAADEILIGIGRLPNLEGLDLERGGIACTAKGITVGETLQTSNPRVYAAGDVCSPYKFTHTADAMARILIANALFMGQQRTSALTIPWCTYTDPEIAHVGMYERDAREKGIEVTTLTVPLTEVDRAVLDGDSLGFARVHLKKGTDTILGATIVARHAGDLISELSLAISNKIGLGKIAATIHPYPTQAEVIRKLADAYNRTRLTPFVKKVLSGWLQWQRRGL